MLVLLKCYVVKMFLFLVAYLGVWTKRLAH